MEQEFNIYAYERNQVRIYSVLGDNNSRSFIFNIIEKTGVISPASNAEPVNQMLDLTGYSINLKNINTSAVVTGTVISAENGKVGFIVDSDFTNNTGDFQCEIVLTKNSEKLSIVGIVLIVDYPEMPGYDFTIKAGEFRKITVTILNPDMTTHIMTSSESLNLCAKKTVNDETPAIFVTAYSNDSEGDGYNIYITGEMTSDLSGDYVYTIYLQDNDGKHPLIPDSTLHIEKGLL